MELYVNGNRADDEGNLQPFFRGEFRADLYLTARIGAFLTEFKIYLSPEIPAITLGVALFTGLISGTIPSLKAAGKNPIDSIKQPNR